jgi:hypothetical protein
LLLTAPSSPPLPPAPAPPPLPSILRPHRRLATVGVVGICVASTPPPPRHADSDDTDGKVDKGEFLEFVFCKLQLCSKADTGPILKRFKELDVDGSGALDKEDFDKMVKDELQKQEMRAAKVERARGHSIFAPKGDPKQHALDGTSKWTGGSAKHQPLEESNGKEVEMTATEVTNPASKSRQNADRHEI